MKMKVPKFLQVKRKQLRATTARKPLRIAATADYDDLAEPNMKLSRALLIVLVLHIVAVSGIIAFNAIKTRQGPMPAANNGPSTTLSAAKPETAVARVPPKEMTRHDEAKASRTASKQPGKDERKTEHVKKASSLGAVDSGKVYVVAKGDNPVSIAKKLKVSYDELLSLNHIEDPHKLQIGQKLLIPNKIPKAKKADE
jgi:LysM repeat protein